MSKKSASCYISVFEYIEKNVFKLEPAEFMADFEGGLRSGINKVYPHSTLRGCWYHYCSALWKKILKLRMRYLIKMNPDAKAILKSMMSLPLLSSDQFEEGYSHIKQMAEASDLTNEFGGFFSYFDSFWINQVIKH